MAWSRRVAGIVVAFVVASVVAGAEATSPGSNGRIAFVSEAANDDQEIATIAPDGTGIPQRLTEDGGADTDPAWSPDGTTIAFETPRDGNADIWAMDADGTDERNVTQTAPGVSSIDPAWSPDSGTIAFTRQAGNQ